MKSKAKNSLPYLQMFPSDSIPLVPIVPHEKEYNNYLQESSIKPKVIKSSHKITKTVMESTRTFKTQYEGSKNSNLNHKLHTQTNESISPCKDNFPKRPSIIQRRIIQIQPNKGENKWKMLRTIPEPPPDQESVQKRDELFQDDEDEPIKFQSPTLEGDHKHDPFFYYYKQDSDSLRFKMDCLQEQPPLLYNLSSQYEQTSALPMKFRIKKNSQADLQLAHYFVGKNHASILGNLFEKHFKNVNLENTQVSHEFLSSIKQLPSNLNLNKNRVSMQSCKLLSSFFSNRYQNLKEIQLEGAKMGNNQAIELVHTLNNNNSLRLLNLSDNLLDDIFAKFFKNILIENQSIEELYLHWNQIKANGAALILEGIVQKDFIKVLDLSWNQMGGKQQQLDRLCRCLSRQKKSIVHLDFSFNHFNYQESLMIQQALKNNKSLMGFHFAGNYGYVDVKGFLQLPEDFQKYSIPTIKPPHRIKGAKPSLIHYQPSNSKYRDNCWICDNWQEVTFTWSLNTERVQLFVSFEDFKPQEMQKELSQFELTKMCPLGKCYFYFMIDKQKRLSDNYQIEQGYNFIDVNPTKQLVDDDFYALIALEPRTQDKAEEEKPPIINQNWKIENSIFKDYKRDTIELLEEAFEFDFSNCKTQRFEKVKNTFKNNYSLIKYLFKYIAAFSVQNNIPVVSQTCLNDLMVFLKLRVQQIDLKFMEAIMPPEKQNFTSKMIMSQNPVIYQQIQNAKGLNRRQFMEFLIRIGEEQQLDMMIEQNIQQAMKGYDPEYWRIRRYWNLFCEKVIKQHMSAFQQIFLKYSCTKIKPFTTNKFLFLEEFRQIWYDSALNTHLTERDISLSFFLSQMTQVDEISTDRYLCLNFLEFLEAFARIAEKLHLAPANSKKKKVNQSLFILYSLITNFCHYVLKLNHQQFVQKKIFLENKMKKSMKKFFQILQKTA